MYIVWVGMSLVWAYFMSIGCSGALKGCLHLTGEGYVHSLAHYCFNGSNIALTCILVVFICERGYVWSSEMQNWWSIGGAWYDIWHIAWKVWLFICKSVILWYQRYEIESMIHNNLSYIQAIKLVFCVVQGGAVKLPALIYPVRRRMHILLFKSISYLYVLGHSIICISYIGQCDLINICFGLLWVWYTPGK